MLERYLLTVIFVPLAGACLLPLMGKVSKDFRNIMALAFAVVSFVFSCLLASSVWRGQAISIARSLPLGFNFTFTADGLAVFMAIVSSFVSAVIILYSFGYISHYQNQNEYYFLVVLFLGSMMGLVFSANLIFLYLFWELTAIVSWRLIGFFREKTHVVRADKSFLVTVFGALLMLFGFLALYQQAGSFDLSVIKVTLATHPISSLTVALILAGILSKSATLPFHTWLPDAGVAPSPVTALLHAAVLVKIGVYVFARLFVVTIPLSQSWHVIVAVIAAASALVSAGAALVDTDLKRIIAYSTISQIGFIFLGLVSGSLLGLAGALLFILMHGLAKAGLFLCAGIVEQNTKIKDITKLGGLIKTMPITAMAFLLCAFSVMGIPPLGGFFSKYMVMVSAAQDGPLGIALLFLAGAFMTILYLFRVFNMVFLGEAKNLLAKEAEPVMIVSVVILAAFSLAAGLLIRYPSLVAQITASQMSVK
jgi:proton-translocating NADH-quinone oxidoreductase chain N